MPAIETDRLPFPRRLAGRLAPPDGYAGLRERPGLVRSALPGGDAVWLVSRHEDVRTVLTDARFSSNPKHDGFPQIGRNGTVPDGLPGWFVADDPPDHARFRKALMPEFTLRRIREMRPAVQRVVDARIDELLASGDSADLVARFAQPVPSLVICELLGVPYDDHEYFESRTQTLVTFGSTDAQRDLAARELLEYLVKMIAEKERRPREDMISRLLAGGVMSQQELTGAALLLLIAGHETTANSIALGTVLLLLNPEWIGDERVVEEVLRYLSIADVVPLRVAVEDVEIGGQLIRAGEGVAPLVAAANHDGAVFPSPGRFDPGRPAKGHVAFGYGVHQCIGQHLGRVEMEIAFETLFRRVPGLRLSAPVEVLPFKLESVLFGLHKLPVAW
jgi:cytochrome P450 monooxygenase